MYRNSTVFLLSLTICTGTSLSTIRQAIADAPADNPQSPRPEITWVAATAVIDVRLDTGQHVHGALYRENRPVASQRIVLWQDGRPVASTTTNELGRFSLLAKGGGLYAIQAGGHRQWCRLWTNEAAPPQAVDQLLVVASDTVVRGQRPVTDFFQSDAFILGAVTAAAIAVPIIVYNARQDKDTGS